MNPDTQTLNHCHALERPCGMMGSLFNNYEIIPKRRELGADEYICSTNQKEKAEIPKIRDQEV